jgi:hypothetical protein
VKNTHNCWAYGMDVLDPAQLTQCLNKPNSSCQLLYHQPGGTVNRSSELYSADGRTCSKVESLMAADVPAIRRSTFKARCPRGTSKIALVVDPGEDYHFYRQDSDGLWSHKDGSNKAKRYDAENRSIWDPKTAARDYRSRGSFLNYEDFCGYYCVPRGTPIKLARDGNNGVPK